VPVLVDGDRVLGDSVAICHYLDRKVPDPPLFTDDDTFELAALADTALNVLVDLGMRYHPLHDHPKFPEVRAEYVGRVQRALDQLGERMPKRGDAWGYADMSVYTLVAWLDSMPARAANLPPVARVLALGWSMPPALSAWAARHRARPNVVALG
jgi:glutathione S-transferase